MAVQEPSWWYRAPSWQSAVLSPVAALYRRIAEDRYRRATPYRAERPVVCVGNFTAGGTGKTPMALLVADLIDEAGGVPWFLSRGYGGRLDGQERVDPTHHTAAEVGDEPLLLAGRAPTVISRNRALGAEFIARQAPANAVIVMDDGLQNPSLAKDLTIALIDGLRGIGNGAVIPAGPLRAGIDFQLGLTDTIVFTGNDDAPARRQLEAFAAGRSVEKLSALAVARGNTEWLKGAKVVAFAGIANPDRFFSLIERLGADIVESVSFRDHETMSATAANALLASAKRTGACLATTEKDYVRLNGLDGSRIELRTRVRAVPIGLDMGGEDRARLLDRIKGVTGQKP